MAAIARIPSININPELVWEHLCDHYNHISNNGFAHFNSRFVAHYSTDVITIIFCDFLNEMEGMIYLNNPI